MSLFRASQRITVSTARNGQRARGLATPAAGGVPLASRHPSRRPPYERLLKQLKVVRETIDRPLTLAEKILYSHLIDPRQTLSGAGKDPSNVRAKRYLPLQVDRLAMQDASAQMALLQFMTCGLPQAAVPASVHCDHLIQAFEGAAADLKRSIASNSEVFAFLESACKKYGIEFWGPGSGIIHQIVLENYAAPGLLMLGTDSHTPNASGLGCLAIGVGGADAVDALTATPWELQAPKVLNINLTGTLSPWCTPKDIILHVVGALTVRGGTGNILEYTGPGLSTLPATGLATMANMGAEMGATTSAFAYTEPMGAYLAATGRGHIAKDAQGAQSLLQPDTGAEYDSRLEVNLDNLEPTINGPFTPDLATPLSTFVARAKAGDYVKDAKLSAALIGSCTNSSYADMARCASLARQATERGMKVATSFDVTPGSEQVRATVERDGIQEDLAKAGARVLANACGPCIGQWDRRELKGEENVILTSFNRNFRGRNDGNAKTQNMLASPEIVTAMAFAGRLDFNPITDTLKAPDGSDFRFEPPSGEELPSRGFTPGDESYLPRPCPEPIASTPIAISPTSSRLEPLEAFDTPFKSGNYELSDMKCLLRIRGKCTTDHISAAGPWLKYKGHLSNLAENTLIGAMNDQDGQVNSAHDLEGDVRDTIPSIAKRYKARSQPWMLVADHNYGEGSAREHAALQPRFFGCQLILARSIARIAETNLRKQGVLTLLFADENDYSKIDAGDAVQTVNLADLLKPDGDLETQVRVRVTKPDGKAFEIATKHSLSPAHLAWIRAGSALNLIREQAALAASHSSAPFSATGSAPTPTPPSPAGGARVRSMSTFALQKRGYATAPKSSGGTYGRPSNDGPVDSNTDSMRRMIFPDAAPAAGSAQAALHSALPYPVEVHDTIMRAWNLHRREQREAQRKDLNVKRSRMEEACAALKKQSPKLFAQAAYRVAPNKRHPDEQARLVKLGLAGGEGGKSEEGETVLVGAEARRKARTLASQRLHGLFPREMRAPTDTPSRNGWPAYQAPDES
ncbi:putative mitochondrial aconitate hydratase [Ceraceosorus guamensis]|uniref:Putative mitochondrial aconitate hydratase n=1 Tax=Ceraceosorus guamensis TaxID=1522189 RepID=A0A316W3I4_9BASI|nr:putative mitochondrial aconitate hydratase [Ceraceosorus guamensis]PWN44436.1 putative mitochondrial aconitate hydratase [Ceraceosorus guamensis]